jgi:FkbM family methyltransferase
MVLKHALHQLGVEITSLKNVPRETFLGLRDRHYDCVLDVGANDGGFARWVSGVLPKVRLHCFEPLPAPASALRSWARRQRRSNVVVHEIALSDFDGEAHLIEHLDHSTSSSLLPITREGVARFPFVARAAKRTVTASMLDTWASRQRAGLGRILLKLDVQGVEDRVLRGGMQTLLDVDVCIVEVNIANLYDGQASFADLVNLLDAAGLSYYGNLEQIHDRKGAPVFVDTVFVRSQTEAQSAVRKAAARQLRLFGG